MPSEEVSEEFSEDEASGGMYSGTEEDEDELGGVTGFCGCEAVDELSLLSSVCSGFCGTPVKNSSSYTIIYPAAPRSPRVRTALRSCARESPAH